MFLIFGVNTMRNIDRGSGKSRMQKLLMQKSNFLASILLDKSKTASLLFKATFLQDGMSALLNKVILVAGVYGALSS